MIKKIMSLLTLLTNCGNRHNGSSVVSTSGSSMGAGAGGSCRCVRWSEAIAVCAAVGAYHGADQTEWWLQ